MMYNDFLEDIQAEIEAICDFLDIEEPAICFSDETLATETTMAGFGYKHYVIYVNPNYLHRDYIGTVFFSVAHECKHAQQYNISDNFIEGYKNSSEVDLKSYNEQEIEVDANAFAIAWMDCNYGDEWDKLNIANKCCVSVELYQKYANDIIKYLDCFDE